MMILLSFQFFVFKLKVLEVHDGNKFQDELKTYQLYYQEINFIQ